MAITIVYEEQGDGTWSAHVEGLENVVRIARAGSVAIARGRYREVLSGDSRAKGHDLEERVVRKEKKT